MVYSRRYLICTKGPQQGITSFWFSIWLIWRWWRVDQQQIISTNSTWSCHGWHWLRFVLKTRSWNSNLFPRVGQLSNSAGGDKLTFEVIQKLILSVDVHRQSSRETSSSLLSAEDSRIGANRGGNWGRKYLQLKELDKGTGRQSSIRTVGRTVMSKAIFQSLWQIEAKGPGMWQNSLMVMTNFCLQLIIMWVLVMKSRMWRRVFWLLLSVRSGVHIYGASY